MYLPPNTERPASGVFPDGSNGHGTATMLHQLEARREPLRPARCNTRRDPRFLVLIVASSDVHRYPAIANHCPCCFGVNNLKGFNRAPRQIGHRISLVLQDKAQRLRLHTNQPWAAQRQQAAHLSEFGTASAQALDLPVMPFPEGLLEMANFSVMGKSNKNNIKAAGFRWC